MQTYWEISVQCYADGKPGASCSCSKPTLPTALTEGVELASYYRICCGYDVTVELTERCCRCHNNGTVNILGPRSSKTVRCPECRGKIATGHVEPFPFRLHDNAVADLGLEVAR